MIVDGWMRWAVIFFIFTPFALVLARELFLLRHIAGLLLIHMSCPHELHQFCTSSNGIILGSKPLGKIRKILSCNRRPRGDNIKLLDTVPIFTCLIPLMLITVFSRPSSYYYYIMMLYYYGALERIQSDSSKACFKHRRSHAYLRLSLLCHLSHERPTTST